jgi:hypothetical protein
MALCSNLDTEGETREVGNADVVSHDRLRMRITVHEYP